MEARIVRCAELVRATLRSRVGGTAPGGPTGWGLLSSVIVGRRRRSTP